MCRSRGRDEDVDAGPLRAVHRLARQVDVPLGAAGQRRDHRPPDLRGDLPHAAVVALGRGREAGLDDVHAERVELARESELLLGGEAVAGSLLAVAERGVEDEDVAGGHGRVSFPMEVNEKSAADLGVRGAGAFEGDSAVSRCSCRHAADPWLTNKDGKQEAKDEDDDETEQHERDVFPLKTGEPPTSAAFGRLTRAKGSCQGEATRTPVAHGTSVIPSEARDVAGRPSEPADKIPRFARDDTGGPVDEYAAMHNNASMTRVVLAPAIVLNTVRSLGATG